MNIPLGGLARKKVIMEIVVELYVCEECSHVENELNGACSECGGVMKCVDFVPREAAQPRMQRTACDCGRTDGKHDLFCATEIAKRDAIRRR